MALLAVIIILAGCGNQVSTSTAPAVGGGGSIIGGATLSWDTPLKNADGSLLTDLQGYKVYYGVSSGNYTQMIDVGNVNLYTLSGLTKGTTYFFTVTTYNSSGIESNYAVEDSKTIL